MNRVTPKTYEDAKHRAIKALMIYTNQLMETKRLDAVSAYNMATNKIMELVGTN